MYGLELSVFRICNALVRRRSIRGTGLHHGAPVATGQDHKNIDNVVTPRYF